MDSDPSTLLLLGGLLGPLLRGSSCRGPAYMDYFYMTAYLLPEDGHLHCFDSFDDSSFEFRFLPLPGLGFTSEGDDVFSAACCGQTVQPLMRTPCGCGFREYDMTDSVREISCIVGPNTQYCDSCATCKSANCYDLNVCYCGAVKTCYMVMIHVSVVVWQGKADSWMLGGFREDRVRGWGLASAEDAPDKEHVITSGLQAWCLSPASQYAIYGEIDEEYSTLEISVDVLALRSLRDG